MAIPVPIDGKLECTLERSFCGIMGRCNVALDTSRTKEPKLANLLVWALKVWTRVRNYPRVSIITSFEMAYYHKVKNWHDEGLKTF